MYNQISSTFYHDNNRFGGDIKYAVIFDTSKVIVYFKIFDPKFANSKTNSLYRIFNVIFEN